MDNLEELFRQFPYSVATDLRSVPGHLWTEAEELRLRRGYPAVLVASGKEYTLSGKEIENITQEILNNTINTFLNYSEYAHEQELKNGYVMLEGGHRAGFCGQAVTEKGTIVTIQALSSINLRFAKEIPEAGSGIWPQLLDPQNQFYHTLIASPPGCGKTTLLRNLIRRLSDHGYQISVCDERNEIAGQSRGHFAFDLGKRTDVLSGCSKEQGMLLMLRSMGPQILATDEVGSSEEVTILRRGVAAGVRILTTVHAGNLKDVILGPLGPLVKDGTIQRILFLTDKPKRGTICGVWKGRQEDMV